MKYLIFLLLFLKCFSVLGIEEFKKYFNRKVDTIEGIWQTPSGCISYIIFDDDRKRYIDVAISGCKSFNVVSGKYIKIDENTYSGEVFVYYDEGSKKWSSSTIYLSYPYNNINKQTYRDLYNSSERSWKNVAVKLYPKNFSRHNSNYENSNTDNTDKFANDDPNEIIAASSGSGFLINYEGYVITNHHVTKGCNEIEIYYNDYAYIAEVINLDSKNDISVLKTNIKPKNILAINYRNPKLLEEIFVAGYPFGNRISSGVKVTKGIVSSLSGIGNNYSNMQIDAAIQSGNSGGPVIDIYGNVLGVAVEKLNYKAILNTFGDLPENTNFGIKSNIIRNFVEANGISLIEPNTNKISLSNLGEIINNTTVYISCLMSYANIKKFKSKKVLFNKLNNNNKKSINRENYKNRKQQELDNIDSIFDRS